jgi:hypothetical protein
MCISASLTPLLLVLLALACRSATRPQCVRTLCEPCTLKWFAAADVQIYTVLFEMNMVGFPASSNAS